MAAVDVEAPGLTLACRASKASPLVITAHRMRAFLLAIATAAFCQPTRSRSAAAHCEIGSLRLWAVITADLVPWRCPRPTRRPAEDAQAFMRRVAAIDVECCPHCRLGRWLVIEQRSDDRVAIAAPLLAACRGPPQPARAVRYRSYGQVAHSGQSLRVSASTHRHAGRHIAAAIATSRGLRRRFATSALPRSSIQRASALPEPAAETYTAHTTAGPAAQCNEVYLTPCTTVPSFSIASASDKRYSLPAKQVLAVQSGSGESMTNRALSVLAGCLTLVGCATSLPSPADVRLEVMATERAFAKTMADRDHGAFATFIADEAVFLSGPEPLHGKRKVVEWWARYYSNPNPPFSWEPEEVEVLESGTLALSSGPVRNADGKVIARFTSVWRRTAANAWQIVFDKGSEVCNCKAQ